MIFRINRKNNNHRVHREHRERQLEVDYARYISQVKHYLALPTNITQRKKEEENTETCFFIFQNKKSWNSIFEVSLSLSLALFRIKDL